MREVSNEELCVIEVDKGMVSDHLPNEVYDGLRLVRRQLIDGCGYSEAAVQKLRDRNARQRKGYLNAIEESRKRHEFVFPPPVGVSIDLDDESEFHVASGGGYDDVDTGTGSLEENADIWNIREDNPYYISVDPSLWGEGEFDSDSEDDSFHPPTAPSKASQKAKRGMPIPTPVIKSAESRRPPLRNGQSLDVVAEVEVEEEEGEEGEAQGRGYFQDPEQSLWPRPLYSTVPDSPSGAKPDTVIELEFSESGTNGGAQLEIPEVVVAPSDPASVKTDSRRQVRGGVAGEESAAELPVPILSLDASPRLGAEQRRARLKGHGLKLVLEPSSPTEDTTGESLV